VPAEEPVAVERVAANAAPEASTGVGKERAPEAPSTPAARTRRPALQEWERLLEALRTDDALLGAVLGHAIPRVVNEERIVLAYADGGQGAFYQAQATTAEAKQSLLRVAERLLGGRPTLEVRLEADAQAGRTVAAVTEHRKAAESESRRRAALTHPKVLEALEVFPEASGNLDVKLRRPA